MTKTVLLTLGRLSKALEIARALSSVGCRVIIAEPFSRHVCKSSNAVAKSLKVAAPNSDSRQYREDMLEVIASESVDLVVPVSEESLHVAAFADLFPEGVRFASARLQVLKGLHDKLQFNRTAASFGLPVPKTFAADDPAALNFSRRNAFVHKPVHSCSGLGVTLHEAAEPIPANSKPAVVQRRVDGRHVSTCAIIEQGRVIGNVCYEGTVFTGTVAVCFQRVDDAPQVHEWGKAFAEASKYDGFLSFDFIISDDGTALPIECNPRVTSGVHFFEPSSLATAILTPAATETLELKEKTRFQQGYSTLTEAYGKIFKPREYLRLMRELFTARDIVWSLRDPLPFLMMTPNSWNVLKPAIFDGISMGEAAMRDIAWFGDVNVPEGSAENHTGTSHASSAKGIAMEVTHAD